MIEITNKRDCCGCEACKQVCPKGCIELEADVEGFAYPRVDKTACVDCGLCERVCPMINTCNPVAPLVTYAAKNKNEATRHNSSSGGVFTLLAEKVIAQGGVVFGAKFNKEWRVEHSYAECVEELSQFRGSKYVQSSIGDSYARVEEFLKGDRKVLFSGTPCQVAGLKHFLRRDYDNLLTIEIVCHGVPSPKVWADYLAEECQKDGKGENITAVSFRDKTNGWKRYDVRIDFASHSRAIFHTDDPFMKGFLKNLTLRPSCYHCVVREGRSGADIALADYWGVWNIHKGFDDDRGVGLVVVNTNKGAEWYEGVRAEVDDRVSDYTKAVAYNPCMIRSVEEPKDRAAFWHLYGDHKMAAVEMMERKIKPIVVYAYRCKEWVGRRLTTKNR